MRALYLQGEGCHARFQRPASMPRGGCAPLRPRQTTSHYGRRGRREEAKCLLRELDQLFTQGQAPPIAFVAIYSGLGDADAAFDWLETAYRLRDDKLFLL